MANSLKLDTMDNQQLRSSNKYGYVYITTNLVNGKKYIGQKKSSVFNPQYLGSGKLLKKAINKYGRDSFKVELVEFASSKSNLDSLEKLIILEHNAVESSLFYNLACGGQGGHIVDFTEEIKQKIRDKAIGRTWSEECRKKRLDYLNNRHFIMSEESREKSRQSNLGKKRSKRTRLNMRLNHADFSGDKNPFYGKKHSQDSKNKISTNNARAHIGKVWVNNKTDTELLITPDKVQEYIASGFVRGRLRKNRR